MIKLKKMVNQLQKVVKSLDVESNCKKHILINEPVVTICVQSGV